MTLIQFFVPFFPIFFCLRRKLCSNECVPQMRRRAKRQKEGAYLSSFAISLVLLFSIIPQKQFNIRGGNSFYCSLITLQSFSPPPLFPHQFISFVCYHSILVDSQWWPSIELLLRHICQAHARTHKLAYTISHDLVFSFVRMGACAVHTENEHVG